MPAFHCLRDLYRHRDLPGYRLLSTREQWRLDCRSLGAFLRSGDCLRIFAWLAIWLLGVHAAVWTAGWPPHLAWYGSLGALAWLLPVAAAARRKHIARLLGHRWPCG